MKKRTQEAASSSLTVIRTTFESMDRLLPTEALKAGRLTAWHLLGVVSLLCMGDPVAQRRIVAEMTASTFRALRAGAATLILDARHGPLAYVKHTSRRVPSGYARMVSVADVDKTMVEDLVREGNTDRITIHIDLAPSDGQAQAINRIPQGARERDVYQALGMVAWLLSHSVYHRELQAWGLFAVAMPAMCRGQFMLYLDARGSPLGFVAWERVTAEAYARLANGQGLVREEDRLEHGHLYLRDFITPWGHARPFIRSLRNGVFRSDDHAISLRRNPDGSVRKVNLWRRGTHEKSNVDTCLGYA
jgi:cytolysin-activating lysine-acyltransferase